MLILVMKSFFVTLNRTRSRILECIYEVNFLFERIKISHIRKQMLCLLFIIKMLLFSHSHDKMCSKNELEIEENPPCHSPAADYKPVM